MPSGRPRSSARARGSTSPTGPSPASGSGTRGRRLVGHWRVGGAAILCIIIGRAEDGVSRGVDNLARTITRQPQLACISNNMARGKRLSVSLQILLFANMARYICTNRTSYPISCAVGKRGMKEALRFRPLPTPDAKINKVWNGGTQHHLELLPDTEASPPHLKSTMSILLGVHAGLTNCHPLSHTSRRSCPSWKWVVWTFHCPAHLRPCCVLTSWSSTVQTAASFPAHLTLRVIDRSVAAF